jgi:GNAT superfamily N-acetyltransferase
VVRDDVLTVAATVTDVELVDLEPGDPRLVGEVLPVLRELRPHLTADGFSAVYVEGHPQGLRFTAAYGRGRCLGVAGWRIVATTANLRKLYVDDLVTTATSRSTGVGRALLADLTERAAAAGCTALDLDSGVQRADAHRFYMREGLTISSFHFARRLA